MGKRFLLKLITTNRNIFIFALLCICILYITLPILEKEYILFNIRKAYENNDCKYFEKVIKKDTNFYYKKSKISNSSTLEKICKNINNHSFKFNNLYIKEKKSSFMFTFFGKKDQDTSEVTVVINYKNFKVKDFFIVNRISYIYLIDPDHVFIE